MTTSGAISDGSAEGASASVADAAAAVSSESGLAAFIASSTDFAASAIAAARATPAAAFAAFLSLFFLRLLFNHPNFLAFFAEGSFASCFAEPA